MEETQSTNAGTPLAGDILIVDDTPANLRLLSSMLTQQAYTVRLAPNGKLALLNAQADPPDLILLDIKMPGLSGYEVCEQLKADPRTRDVPIIFISALDQTEDKVKAFTHGGVDYITKPFQIEEVLARVETHLSLYALRRQLAATNKQLQAANAELEASNADLRTFADAVAHDLKSPLSVVLGFSELLESDLVEMSPEKIVEHLGEMAANLHKITRTGHKMLDIIESLLLFASVRQVSEIECGPLDMGTIVGNVLTQLASDIEAVRATVITPAAWPTACGYAPWIEQVWVNYVNNALKYSGDVDNGIAPRIELGAWNAEGQAGYCFFVHDNGPGLTSEEQARVFMPFTRFHQSRAKGHGLGLSIVQRIVEKLGGQVGVDSAGTGQGSTFWFVLP